jgi:hypothetical protein
MRKGGGSMKDNEMKEMVEKHEQGLQEIGGFLTSFSSTVMSDLNKLNMLVLALMKKDNLIEEYECKCGFTTLIPKLEHVELDTTCPQCGAEYDFGDSNQTKVHDWDNGITQEEE